MIRKECFIRRHFWVEKNKLYHPRIESTPELLFDLQWTDEHVLLTFSETPGQPFHVSWPEYQEKDALLLFFDTRSSLKTRIMVRHCHEFLLLPEAVEGIQTKEITQFHGYSARPLVHDNALSLSTEIKKESRHCHVRVPQEALFGWEEDMKEFSFAFSYFSEGKEPIHFPIPHSSPEKIPYMWPICHLTR